VKGTRSPGLDVKETPYPQLHPHLRRPTSRISILVILEFRYSHWKVLVQASKHRQADLLSRRENESPDH
jgi:hypothetical protein